MDEALTEEKIDSALVYDGALLKVRRDEVRLPDGRVGIREHIRHPGASVVIPILPSGNLLFVRQFRYPLSQAFIEFPAGKIDFGETPLQCAMRELREETGHDGRNWREIATFHPCIGYSDERLVYFISEAHPAGEIEADEEEFLVNVEMSLDDALKGVREGRITDGKTVSGLFLAEKYISGAWS